MLIKAILELKLGIETKDWDKVISAYKYLSGDSDVSQSDLMAAPVKKDEKRTIREKINSPNMVIKKVKVGKGKNAKSVTLVTDKEDSDLSEHNKNSVTTKDRRPKPKRTRGKCENCNQSFIIEKVYPVGIPKSSEGGHLLCGDCSNKGILVNGSR